MCFQNIRHILHQINTSISLLKWNSDQCVPHKKHNPKLEKEIEHLEELVNKMHRLMEKSSFNKNKQPIELNKILQETYSLFHNKAQKHKLLYQVEKSCLQETFTTDPFYLEELLLILLDNAITHTPEGKNIKLKLRKDTASTYITIENEGVGIPRDLFLEISQNQEQIEGSATGHGFGLCLARDIAKQLGLLLVCQSKIEKYTKFSIRFPQ